MRVYYAYFLILAILVWSQIYLWPLANWLMEFACDKLHDCSWMTVYWKSWIHSFYLFQRLFREMMLLQFLSVLLQVLVSKSHDLLQEEIAITLYNMAHVDFDIFFTKFLPQFLESCDGIDSSQKTVLAQNFKMDKVSSYIDRKYVSKLLL